LNSFSVVSNQCMIILPGDLFYSNIFEESSVVINIDITFIPFTFSCLTVNCFRPWTGMSFSIKSFRSTRLRGGFHAICRWILMNTTAFTAPSGTVTYTHNFQRMHAWKHPEMTLAVEAPYKQNTTENILFIRCCRITFFLTHFIVSFAIHSFVLETPRVPCLVHKWEHIHKYNAMNTSSTYILHDSIFFLTHEF
jgi:hypothetical protein